MNQICNNDFKECSQKCLIYFDLVSSDYLSKHSPINKFKQGRPLTSAFFMSHVTLFQSTGESINILFSYTEHKTSTDPIPLASGFGSRTSRN